MHNNMGHVPFFERPKIRFWSEILTLMVPMFMALIFFAFKESEHFTKIMDGIIGASFFLGLVTLLWRFDFKEGDTRHWLFWNTALLFFVSALSTRVSDSFGAALFSVALLAMFLMAYHRLSFWRREGEGADFWILLTASMILIILGGSAIGEITQLTPHQKGSLAGLLGVSGGILYLYQQDRPFSVGFSLAVLAVPFGSDAASATGYWIPPGAGEGSYWFAIVAVLLLAYFGIYRRRFVNGRQGEQKT